MLYIEKNCYELNSYRNMATSAEIQKYSHHQDGYVEYFIKVVHNGRIWGIRKRYSHFLQLHEHLIKQGYIVDTPLPKKSWKKFDEARLKKRLKALQDYIDSLLRVYSLSDNSLLKEFFEVETVWLQIAKKQSFKEIQSSEKLTRLPKTLQTWMIAVPYTRNRSNTGGYGRPPSGHVQFMSPHRDKTKSVSFSSFSLPMPMVGGRSNSRKESMAAELASTGRDRKFSVDIFNLSYNSGNNYAGDHLSAAASAMKKGAFIKSTQVLWKHYQEEAQYICEEINFLKPGAAGAVSSSSSSSTIRGTDTAALFKRLIEAPSMRPELSTALRKIEAWEEETLRLLLEKSVHATTPQRLSDSNTALGIATGSFSAMVDDLSMSEEETVGIPVKDLVIHTFTQLRGSSHDSKMSAGDAESVGTSIESLSLKG